MLIAVINQASVVSNTEAQIMCSAIQKQFDLHFNPAWGNAVGSNQVKFYSDASKVPGYAWQIALQDASADPSLAGVLGYHTIEGDKISGIIFAKVVIDASGVVLYDAANPNNTSVASVLSHECLEAANDRYCNIYALGPQLKQGNLFAFEMCDPVENDSYIISVGNQKVSVSNFIFPSWINSQAGKANMPFDYMKKLTAPFTMSAGGYLVIMDAAGNQSQIFGEEFLEWKKTAKIRGRMTTKI
jgi:hypothetical protein